MLKIRPELPIILCSGYLEKISKIKAKSLGIKGFLNKPVGNVQVLELVEDLLDENITADLTAQRV